LQQCTDVPFASVADHQQVGASGLFSHVLERIGGQGDGAHRDAEPIGQAFGYVCQLAGAMSRGSLSVRGQHHEFQNGALLDCKMGRAFDGEIGLRREVGDGQDGSDVHVDLLFRE